MKYRQLKKLCMLITAGSVAFGAAAPSAAFAADDVDSNEKSPPDQTEYSAAADKQAALSVMPGAVRISDATPVQTGTAAAASADTTADTQTASDTPTPEPSASPTPGVTPTVTPAAEPSSGSEQTGEKVTPGPSTDSSSSSASSDSGKTSGQTTKTDSQSSDKSESVNSNSAGDKGTGNNTEEIPEAEDETDKTAEEDEDETDEEDTEEEEQIPEPIIVRPGTGSRVITEPDYSGSMHFRQIGKIPRLTKTDTDILEEKKDDSRVIGKAGKQHLLYIIEDNEDGWLYVESGDVRGFVRSDEVWNKERSEKLIDRIYIHNGVSNDEARADFDWSPYLAETVVPREENSAYTYSLATTKNVVIDKKYAVPEIGKNSYLNIREDKSTSARSVGRLTSDGYMYVILDDNSEWLYVESGDVRGFVSRQYVDDSSTVTDRLDENLDGYVTAETSVSPEENKAYYYTITSVESGDPVSETGKSVVEYASQYIGNPYVWGGTSLINGADCSGFVQSIYAQYGIVLPRTTENQAQAGTAIPISDAAPGDLVFYRDGSGYIYHVMIYAGNGQTIEAANSQLGIIRGHYNYNGGLDYAVRLFGEESGSVKDTGYSAKITPTASSGGVYTYEKWNTAWTPGTYQKALHDQYENYDSEGFGKIGDRYVIACTTTFGRVGDLIDFELSDGTVIKTVMGDAKNQSDPGCNIYGHQNGKNVIEFIVNGDMWYGGHANAGTASCHPEWGGKTVANVYNYGNILN